MKSWLDMIIKSKRKLGLKILLIFPGIISYFALNYIFERGSKLLIMFHKLNIIYLIVVFILIANAIMFTFLDLYSKTAKNRSHPLKGVVQGIQVVLFFIGAILIVAILFDKSPSALLTGLGASAAVLMLVFKDSILGFVAGVQLAPGERIPAQRLPGEHWKPGGDDFPPAGKVFPGSQEAKAHFCISGSIFLLH